MAVSRKRSEIATAVRVMVEDGEWKLKKEVVWSFTQFLPFFELYCLRSGVAVPTRIPGSRVYSPPLPPPNPRPLMAQFMILDQTSSMERSDKEGKILSAGAIVLAFDHNNKQNVTDE